MKRMVAVMIALVILTGCTGKRDELDRAMKLRANLLGCLGCSFDVTITADYGDELHKFSMNCQTGGRGAMSVRLHGYRECPMELGATSPRRSVDPLDTSKYILAARSALEGGIFNL